MGNQTVAENSIGYGVAQIKFFNHLKLVNGSLEQFSDKKIKKTELTYFLLNANYDWL